MTIAMKRMNDLAFIMEEKEYHFFTDGDRLEIRRWIEDADFDVLFDGEVFPFSIYEDSVRAHLYAELEPRIVIENLDDLNRICRQKLLLYLQRINPDLTDADMPSLNFKIDYSDPVHFREVRAEWWDMLVFIMKTHNFNDPTTYYVMEGEIWRWNPEEGALIKDVEA